MRFTSSKRASTRTQVLTKSIAFLLVIVLTVGTFSTAAFAAAGVPKLINLQGRLLDNSGNLLGGSGTDYCFRFSLYDNVTVGAGTKLWPAGTPSTMTYQVKQGVFDASIGDTGAGGDALTYDFQTNDTTFINTEVASQISNSCVGVSWETLGPRQRVTSAAYAINSGTVGGFTPAQSATGSQIPALTSGAIVLGDTAPGVRATGSTALTFQNGVTGDIQFFSSSNKLTSSGALTIAGAINGLTITPNATGFSLAGGTTSKTLTINNTLTLAGTDGSTLNIGAGGTLGTAAYTASSAYEVPLTFSTGLTRSVNTITVNTSQNISTLSNLTSNGIVTTSGGTGALSVTGTTGSGNVVLATSPTFGTSIITPSVTASAGLTISAGGTAQNISLTPTTTGAVVVGSSTAGADTIQILPQSSVTTNSFGGIITSADITGSNKTWTFPDVSGTIITTGDTGSVTNTMLAGSIAASKLVGSDIDTVGSLTSGQISTGFGSIDVGANSISGGEFYFVNSFASTGSYANEFDAYSATTMTIGPTVATAITIGKSTITTTVASNLTLTTGRTFTINGDGFTDLTGNGLTDSGNTLTLNLTSSGTTGATASNSGLELGAGGLSLLKGCTDGQLLEWTDAGGWACANDDAGGGSGLTIGTTTITSGVSGRVLYNNGGTLGEMTTTGTGTVLALATSPAFTTPSLGVATATSINGLTLTSSTGTLSITNAKTLAATNTLTFSGTDGSTLNIGAGGTLGSNAYTSTAFAPLASPTFTGTVTIPTPFTLGATSVTSTGTQLNYLASATGTTGTTSTNLVYSASPTFTGTVSGANLALTSSNTTQVTTASALSLAANSLTTGTGIYAASSSLTSGKLVDLQVSGTAAAASQTALNILTTGANATAGITTYGIQVANTHSTNTSTNVGLYATASGGATANYAAIFDQGTVGIGTTTPDTAAALQVNGDTYLRAVTGQTRDILFTNVGGGAYPSVGGAARILGDGGDFYWQAAGGSGMQLAAYHEVILQGGRTSTSPLNFINGSNNKYNTRIINPLAANIGLSIESAASATGDYLQLTTSGGATDGDILRVTAAGRIISNSATDNGATLQITGTGTMSGSLTLGVASTTAGQVTFNNATNAFTQSFSGSNPGASINYILPTTAPTSGQVLSSTAPSGGNATLSWVTGGGGSGTVTNTGGNLTANAVVLGAGTVDTKVSTGITTNGVAGLVLGVNATTIGTLKLFGSTSGDVTLTPNAVAGTATVLTLPSTTGTLALTASPTFTGTVTIPTPFTLGATSVTSTGTQLNYLAAATGTTGTTSTNLVFSTSPTLVTPTLGVASATSLAASSAVTVTGSAGRTLTLTNSNSGTTGVVGVDIAVGTTGDIRMGALNAGTNTFGGGAFQLFSDSNASFPGQVYFDAGNSASAASIFRVGLGGTVVEGMRVTNNARVGIGITSGGNGTVTELLTIGTAGSKAGTLSLAGATSGKAIINVSAIAGTPTITLPTTTGTLALTASPTFTGTVTAPNLSLTAANALSLGTPSSIAGQVVFSNATNAFTQTFTGSNPGASINYILPATAPTVGQVLSSTAPSGGIATLSWATAGGGISDGDKGDITVSSSGAQWDIDLLAAVDGASATTSSGSGLESLTGGLAMLQGCADGQILKWNETTDVWACGVDAGAGSSPFGISAGLITKTTASDVLVLQYGDAADTQLLIENTTNNVINTADAMSIDLTGGTTGIVTSGVDGLSIAMEVGNGTANTNSGLTITMTPVNTPSGDEVINGITIANLTSSAATENGLSIGTGWDNDIAFIDTTPTMSIADNGTLVLSDGSSTTNDIFQVGTATSRGNALVYGDLIVKGGTIARNLTGVIDTFVYDTSTDVDGGEWRNSLEMMQRSWAQETKDDGAGDSCNIATDDRCGNAAFPRKAIIATTADGLYIFDGADNSLWMKFTQAGTYALGADTNNNPSGVAAGNGVVVVGTNGASATGMYAIDFKQDTMYRYNTTNRTQADTNIANRNTTATYSANAETGFAIIDNVVNDVSLNVQTGSMENRAGTLIAPIDSQGGPLLGVTIVAAATDSGVSVINMGTRKVVNYSDATSNDYNQVYITKRGRMYATNETLGQLEEWRAVDTVITTQANGTPSRVYDELLAGGTPITLAGAVPTISTSPSALAVIERASSAREAAAAGQIDSGDVVFVGTNQGLAEVHTSGGTLPAASWSKITTKDDATPYMNGSVRSVYLFDDAAGATSTNSAVGTTGTTRNPMDSANATAPTFGGAGIRGGAVNFNNNSYLCSDANADGTCDTDADIAVGTTSFTVSLWFKHSVTAAADVLFERCYTAVPAAAVGCVYAGMTSTGTITAGIDDDATFTTVGTISMDDALTSAGTWNDNQWHHLVLTNTDTDLCMYIDGRLAVACDTTLAAAATLDASQVLTIGGRCTGANCVTGDSFWDGQIDEFTWSAGATTGSGLVSAGVNRRFLDGRTHMIRPSTTVTDATTFSSTTIGDSGESYVPNAFTSLVVEITGGTGAGQTRSIISNNTTTFTVYPAWTVTPDATSDFRVSPAKLYGSTNTVTAVAVDAPTQINKTRSLYVGTSDGADGGGVSVFTNAGAGGLKTEVYSSDSGVENDDLGTAWSGTGSDDIKAIGIYTDTIAFATGAGVRVQRKDVSLKQLQADTALAIDDIRMSLVASGLFGASQDVLGLGQGADLAEYYYSNTSLEAGDVVAINPDQDAGIGKSGSKYQKNLLGVISTKPGLILGPRADNAYAVALSGRVPVKFTEENGPIKVGDLLTSSSRPGYAMRATGAGSVIGRALNEPYAVTSCDAPLPNLETTENPEGPWVGGENLTEEATATLEQVVSNTEPRCGYVMLFVGLGESLGQNVQLLAQEFGGVQNGQVTAEGISGPLGTQSSILNFLRSIKTARAEDVLPLESIFTDRIAAGVEILTPGLYADDIYTKTITALEGNSVALVLGEDGTFVVKKSTDGSAAITLDVLGNAVFSGKVTAAEIDAAKITGFDALIARMTALESLLQANAFDALTSVTTQNFKATGDSSFDGKVSFKGLSFFTSTTTFDSDVLFNAPVEFTLPPLFNSDTAGFAVIKAGDKKVRVVFDQEYAVTPVVAGEVTFEATDNIDEVSAADLFEQDVRYLILGKDQTGFTILLNKPAPQNIRFSWVALGVRDPKIIESIFEGLILEIPVEDVPPPTDSSGDIESEIAPEETIQEEEPVVEETPSGEEMLPIEVTETVSEDATQEEPPVVDEEVPPVQEF